MHFPWHFDFYTHRHWHSHLDVLLRWKKQKKNAYAACILFFLSFSCWSFLKHCQYKCISFFFIPQKMLFHLSREFVQMTQGRCYHTLLKTFNSSHSVPVFESQVVETRVIASLRTHSSLYKKKRNQTSKFQLQKIIYEMQLKYGKSITTAVTPTPTPTAIAIATCHPWRRWWKKTKTKTYGDIDRSFHRNGKSFKAICYKWV